MPRAAVLGRVVAGALFVAYPILVWWGLRQGSARTVALALLAVVLPLGVLRWCAAREGGAAEAETPRGSLRGLALLPLATIVALSLAALLDRAGYVLAVPTVINAAFLLAFGVTLRDGAMPMIERFARLQESELSPAQLAWCRLWTWIWCAFFVANGTTAAVLALAAPLDWWAVYTGLLSYALMGVLFTVEWAVRRRRFG